MTNRGIKHALRAGHRCLAAMRDNASYIQGELPSISLPDRLRARVGAACADLAGAADRAARVLDAAGSLAASPSAAEEIRGADLADVVESIHAEMAKMHEVVLALKGAAATDTAHGAAYVLVAESAVNILQAFSRFQDATAASGTNQSHDDAAVPGADDDEPDRNDRSVDVATERNGKPMSLNAAQLASLLAEIPNIRVETKAAAVSVHVPAIDRSVVIDPRAVREHRSVLGPTGERALHLVLDIDSVAVQVIVTPDDLVFAPDTRDAGLGIRIDVTDAPPLVSFSEMIPISMR